MGGNNSKNEAEKQIISQSSGTHLLELHVPTAAAGVGTLLFFVALGGLILVCLRACKRKKTAPPLLPTWIPQPQHLHPQQHGYHQSPAYGIPHHPHPFSPACGAPYATPLQHHGASLRSLLLAAAQESLQPRRIRHERRAPDAAFDGSKGRFTEVPTNSTDLREDSQHEDSHTPPALSGRASEATSNGTTNRFADLQ